MSSRVDYRGHNLRMKKEVADHAKKLGFAILGKRTDPIRADLEADVSFRFNTVPLGLIYLEYGDYGRAVKLTVAQFLKASKIQVIENLDLTNSRR